MEKRDVWFLEMDEILIPLDRVYRIGKNKDIHLPVESSGQLQANVAHINASLRFVSKNIEENSAMVYMPNSFDKPFIMSFYKDKPFLLNGKLTNKSFLRENDVLKLDGYGEDRLKEPFIIKKKSVLQKNGLKAMLVGAVNKDDIAGYENSVHSFRGMLLDKGAKPENVKTYLDNAAQRFNIRDGLEKMIVESDYTDTTLFYFCGHAGEKGFNLFGYDSLESNSLYKLFNEIKGKKAVVLECCHSKDLIDGLCDSAYFFGASKEKAFSQEYALNISNFTRLFLQTVNGEELMDLSEIRENDMNVKFLGLSSEIAQSQRVYFKRPAFYL